MNSRADPILNSDPVLDSAIIAELREVDQSLLDELVDLFAEKTPLVIQKLADEFSAGDLKAAEMTAHTLKGSTGNLGARRMHRICTQLTDLAGEKKVDDVAILLEALRAELGPTIEALRGERSSSQSATKS
jgi:HPt (histidine-containing phosphotransfer) domain-containing protein